MYPVLVLLRFIRPSMNKVNSRISLADKDNLSVVSGLPFSSEELSISFSMDCLLMFLVNQSLEEGVPYFV